jgi:hypothetical protein
MRHSYNHLLKFNNFVKIVAFIVISSLSITSCQDDPVIEEVENGVPVITPKSKASIVSVQLNDFPDLDPLGMSWDTIALTAPTDSFGRADIFFNFTDPSPQPPVFWSQGSHYSNVAPDDTVAFVLLDPYQVEPFGSYIDVNIYDYELPDSTLMQTVNFLIGEYPDPQNPYPDYVTTVQNGYSVTIGIKWEE